MKYVFILKTINWNNLLDELNMTENIPEISVIIPIYNSEKYISRCINSVLSQTFNNFEILLIDDGSTDKSSKICDEYAVKDKRVKVFHKENGGVSSARNVGLDNAKGKWVTFIDSDDYIYENTFNLISSHNEDLLIFNYDVNCNGTIRCGESLPCEDSYQIKNFLDTYLCNEVFRIPWGKFFKRKLINLLRFNSKIAIGEDTLFVLQYLQKCRYLFVFEHKYYMWSTNSFIFKSKYKLNTEQAIYIVTSLYSEYKSLNVNCLTFEKNIYNIYLYLCENDLLMHGTMWFKNKTIIQFWNEIKSSYSLKKRIEFRLKRYKFILYLLRLYHQKFYWSYN